MNAPNEMTHEDVLRVKLGVLAREHRDLDEAISALEERPLPDQLTLRRLGKSVCGHNAFQGIPEPCWRQ